MTSNNQKQSISKPCARTQAEAQACRAPSAPAPGSDDSPGAPPSNTAPANCIDEIASFLRGGIDSLYLSFQGDLDPEVEQCLSLLKTKAQSHDPDIQANAVIELGDHKFEVKPKGNGMFAYVIADGWFYIKVSGADAERMPLCHVQISSELLTRSGVEEPLKALRAIVRLLGVYSAIRVSRVDLCCDFTTNLDLSQFSAGYWVKRVRHFDYHMDGETFTGFTFGRRKTVRANLYHKSLEIKESGKEYMRDIWWLAGWDRESTVWRLEFQFYRKILSDFDIHSPHELLEKLNSLWTYATHQWLRLTVPSSDKTKSRWKDHFLWKILKSASFGQSLAEPLKRVPKTRIPSDKYFFINGIASITSFMAARNIVSFKKAIKRFVEEADTFHAWRLQKYGMVISLEEYAREKARLKARKYCTQFGGENEQ